MYVMGRYNNWIGVAVCIAMHGLIDAATIDPQFARNVTVYHVRTRRPSLHQFESILIVILFTWSIVLLDSSHATCSHDCVHTALAVGRPGTQVNQTAYPPDPRNMNVADIRG